MLSEVVDHPSAEQSRVQGVIDLVHDLRKSYSINYCAKHNRNFSFFNSKTLNILAIRVLTWLIVFATR